MKKTMLILLAMLMCISLVGCGPATDPKDEEKEGQAEDQVKTTGDKEDDQIGEKNDPKDKPTSEPIKVITDPKDKPTSEPIKVITDPKGEEKKEKISSKDEERILDTMVDISCEVIKDMEQKAKDLQEKMKADPTLAASMAEDMQKIQEESMKKMDEIAKKHGFENFIELTNMGNKLDSDEELKKALEEKMKKAVKEKCDYTFPF